MKTFETQIIWTAVKGEVVSYNHQHGLFVVAYPDGGIITIASTVDIMLQCHPKK